MGMVGCFAAADMATLDRLRSDPAQIEDFLYPDDGDSAPPNYAEIDKAWHCIHFMLCGGSGVGHEPLSLAILGGVAAGPDVGYGPARFLNSSQVCSIAGALASIDDKSFKERFDPPALARSDIYLSEMCVRDGDEALEYLLENFQAMKSFYRDAASRGDGAVLWLS